jgi:hypothetical protein
LGRISARRIGQTYLFLDRLEDVDTLNNKLLESALARRAASLGEIGNFRSELEFRFRRLRLWSMPAMKRLLP